MTDHAAQLRERKESIMPEDSTVSMHYISLDEMVEISDRLAFTLRQNGLKDHALDVAIVAALHPLLRQIEQHRQTEADRRSRVRLVD